MIGTTRELDRQTIVVGQEIYCSLHHAGRGWVSAIHGEQSPESCGNIGNVLSHGGRATFDILFENGTQSRQLPECILRGIQWRIYGKVKTADELRELRQHVVDETARRDAEAAAASDRRANERAAHLANNPHLTAAASKPELSPGRLAAANIRVQLKRAFPGFTFSVKSDYNSVDVAWTDGPTRPEVDAIALPFKAGDFDGMEDIYRDNPDATFADVFGSPRYVFCHRSETVAGLREAVRRAELVGVEVPDDWAQNCWRMDQDAKRLILDAFHATSLYEQPQAAPVESTAAAGSAPVGAEVQKHRHTKRDCDFWLVVLAGRVERDEFERIRDACKAAGGWYSRQWGSTPGGFAFDTEATAQAFAAFLNGGESDSGPDSGGDDGGDQPPAPKPKPNGGQADKLRRLADGMQKTIDDKLRPMTQNWTPKRGREYDSRIHDGHNLQRAQQALQALADAHEAGTLPAILAGIKTKADVIPLTSTRAASSGYYSHIDTGEFSDQSETGKALRAMMDGAKSDADRLDEIERKREREIETAQNNLRRSDIPGFFPTPPELAARVIQEARIEHGHRVLEPSAGIGSLAEACPNAANVDCVERMYPLCDILDMKEFATVRGDFLEQTGTNWENSYDRVVMNPPFENSQDREHVQHAFTMLKPGGRLVAIMSAGVFYRSGAKDEAFRAWLDEVGADVEDLPAGCFDGPEAFRSTGVAAKLVVIQK